MQPKKKEIVFPEERKDLESKTSSFDCFLDYLVPDKNACQRKSTAQGAGALQTEKTLEWQDDKTFPAGS